jgi:hypothetical protein
MEERRAGRWAVRSLLLVTIGTAISWLGCTGAIGDASDRIADPANEVPGSGPFAEPPAGSGISGAAKSPLRRLTRIEYDNTVRDLLGDETRPAAAFPADARGPAGFLDPVAVGDVEVQRLLDAGEALARTAVARRLPALLACDPSARGEATCASEFVRNFGRRAYRRPLRDDEATRLIGLYDAVRAPPIAATFAEGIETVLAAILQSPAFLYHWESVGPEVVTDGRIRLSPHVVAARLSYFLWRSMPDEALDAAADQGTLADPAEIARHARRLLSDPVRAPQAIADFQRQLFDVEHIDQVAKDPGRHPEYDTALKHSMLAEFDAFVTKVTLERGALSALFQSERSFVDAKMASFYGLAPVSSTTEITLPPQRRAGVLGLPAFLSVHASAVDSSAVKRGKIIREALLCQPIPPPPPGVDTTPPAPTAEETSRQAMERHVKAGGTCANCHRMIDPLGFAFEHFDAVGRHRVAQAGQPIDARTTIEALDGRSVAVEDGNELARLLSTSPTVRECMTRQWFRFASGRREVGEDGPSLAAAHETFAREGYDVRELLVAITTSPAFLYRGPSEGEVTR